MLNINIEKEIGFHYFQMILYIFVGDYLYTYVQI